MRTRMIGVSSALALVMLLGAWTITSAAPPKASDFALFDGTNPSNQPFSGAVCGSGKPSKLGSGAFTYNVSVSNFSSSTAVLRITFRDGDFVRYQVPGGQSFSLTQAGSASPNNAVRVTIENSGELAGEASAVIARPGDSDDSTRSVFCISCDADSAGDAACDAIIAD